MSDKKQKKQQGPLPSILKHFTIIFLPLLVFMASIAIFFYYTKAENIKEESKLLETNEVANVDLQIETIINDFNSVVSDLMVLSGHYEFQEKLYSDGPHNHKALANEFLVFCDMKRIYDQIRYLDNTGKEIIRTNLNAGKPYIVPEEQLQMKGERYYFEDIFCLNKGEVFISPFDLNIEEGVIEEPLKPMIRFGTPIFDNNGQKRGVVILNYLGGRLLNKIKAISANTSGDIMLLNSDGYWLYGVKPEDEWGFMYEDRENITFYNAFPDAWHLMSKVESGHFHNANGLFTFETVYPMRKEWTSTTGTGKAFERSGKKLDAKKYKWKVVSHVGPEIFHKRLNKAFNILLIVCGILTVVIGVGSWFLASASVHRRIAETQTHKLSRAVEQSASTVMITDNKGNIEYVNPRFTQLTGYTLEETIGQNPRIIKSGKTPHEIYSKLWETIKSGNEWHGEICNKKKNGGLYWESTTISPVKNKRGDITHFIAVKEDITEKRRTEEQIKASLKEKEILLKEVHHRVKNNMQTISSLLNLQSNNINDKHLTNVFKESQNRIKSMALIHEELYQNEDLAHVDFSDYVRTLTGRLLNSYAVNPDNVLLDINIDNLFLGVDMAIPCGLIINELFTNSLKYAFPSLTVNNEQGLGGKTQSDKKGAKGKICINFHSGNNKYTLIVSDNGKGLPEDFDFENIKTLGLDIVNSLVAQLNGTIEFNRSNGTEFKITFAA